jgi:hypothetical protein
MQLTFHDVINQEFDTASAERIYFKAGDLEGKELFNALITEKKDFNTFVKGLQELLATLRIGTLRIEKADLENLELTLTVADGLECSGPLREFTDKPVLCKGNLLLVYD